MREDYQAVMETQLNQWNAQTERFQAAVARMGAQVKAQCEENLALLRAKQEEAWDNFHKLTNASDGAPWEQFKVNMDKASREVRAAGERMTTQFNE
ncbi:MAG: hypothetical protein ABWY07_14000 [Burkholderiales bacterium]